jgi:2-keto-4-pentenoate hydratase/2-oxohepta-3-ene-1,7-dioic acid hydratase in catechol pathway
VSSSTPSSEVIWIGRVAVPGELRERVVRVRTSGRAPTSDDSVEEIDDPFWASLPSTGGQAHADPVELARSSAPRAGGVRAPLGELELRPPVRPGKIVCVGRNYAAHVKEMGNELPEEPLLFTKPASALLASGAPLDLPRGYERIDMEAELVVVVGRRGRGFAAADALQHVAGWTLGNDVSNRDLQKKDRQWTRAKGFDGFAPLGPFVRLGAAPPRELRVQGRVDGTLRQDAPLSSMLFDIPTVLAYIAQVMTLEPGDIVYTGTPEGVTALVPGCVTEVSATGVPGFDLGTLSTPVR